MRLILLFIMLLTWTIASGQDSVLCDGQWSKVMFYVGVRAGKDVSVYSTPGAAQSACHAKYDKFVSQECTSPDDNGNAVWIPSIKWTPQIRCLGAHCDIPPDGNDVGYYSFYYYGESGDSKEASFFAPMYCARPPPPPHCTTVCKDCQTQCLINTSASNSPPADAGSGGSGSGSVGPASGDPVAVMTGLQYEDRTDISLDAGTWTLDIAPYYSSAFQGHTVHGYGWSSVLGMRMFRKSAGGYTVRDERGFTEDFAPMPSGGSYPFDAANMTMSSGGLPLSVDSVAGTWM